jgi:hypothetical protein
VRISAISLLSTRGAMSGDILVQLQGLLNEAFNPTTSTARKHEIGEYLCWNGCQASPTSHCSVEKFVLVAAVCLRITAAYVDSPETVHAACCTRCGVGYGLHNTCWTHSNGNPFLRCESRRAVSLVDNNSVVCAEYIKELTVVAVCRTPPPECCAVRA